MAITLDTITLPDNLFWADEFDWAPVRQATEYTLTGSLIVEEATMLSGRPITLTTPAGGDWVARSTVSALHAKEVANTTMTLTLHDGRSFQVRWRFDETPLEAAPIPDGVANPDALTLYRMSLKFIEV